MNKFVIPSIDLLDGKIVRLYKGSYHEKTVYEIPIKQLMEKYESFNCLHVVDLNGAKGDGMKNLEIIKEIRKRFKGKIQLGGGIRTLEIAQNVMNLGIDCVVFGTIAITNQELIKSIISYIGKENSILALDCKFENGTYFPKANGWIEDSKKNLFQIMDSYESIVERFLVTDIAVDGTMQGVNTDLYLAIKKQFPQVKLQASGGVSNIEDVKKLMKVTDSVIIGKALYEGILDDILN